MLNVGAPRRRRATGCLLAAIIAASLAAGCRTPEFFKQYQYRRGHLPVARRVGDPLCQCIPRSAGRVARRRSRSLAGRALRPRPDCLPLRVPERPRRPRQQLAAARTPLRASSPRGVRRPEARREPDVLVGHHPLRPDGRPLPLPRGPGQVGRQGRGQRRLDGEGTGRVQAAPAEQDRLPQRGREQPAPRQYPGLGPGADRSPGGRAARHGGADGAHLHPLPHPLAVHRQHGRGIRGAGHPHLVGGQTGKDRLAEPPRQ